MATSTTQYSPNAVTFTVNGFVVSDFAEDTFIEVTAVEPGSTITYGADGGASVSYSAIRGAKVVITVKADSPTSTVLSGLMQTNQNIVKAGLLPAAINVTLFNAASGTSLNGRGAFTDVPTLTYAKIAGNRVYGIELPDGFITYVEGTALFV